MKDLIPKNFLFSIYKSNHDTLLLFDIDGPGSFSYEYKRDSDFVRMNIYSNISAFNAWASKISSLEDCKYSFFNLEASENQYSSSDYKINYITFFCGNDLYNVYLFDFFEQHFSKLRETFDIWHNVSLRRTYNFKLDVNEVKKAKSTLERYKKTDFFVY